MLKDAAWAAARPAILRALGRSEDARVEIGRLCEQLYAAYQRANANLPENPDLRFDNDGLVLSHLDRLEEPPSLIALRRDIQARLPKGDLPDILLEVCARTNLADSFTHVNERGARVADFPISLAAVLVAESCNIGFEPLIRSDIPALRRDRLSWVSQNFIRDQTLRAANARLVVSHDALPIVRLWGSGDVASADGVRFVVRGEPIHAGYNPKYFGRRRGVTWYNLVSDQSTGLGGISVPGRQTNRVGQALRMAASTARNSKTAIGAAHRRRLSRMDCAKAVKATAHQLARLIYAMLTRGEQYVERDLATMETERRDRQIKYLQRQARHFDLALVPAEQAA